MRATSKAHQAARSVHAPAAAKPPIPAATACDQVFSFPRSRACTTTPRSSAASRSPEIRNSRATLVANRGEIAIRIFRTLRELGVGTVAVYSEADCGSLHLSYADEAFLIGPGAPAESYLNQRRILETAGRAGAEAIHPGYGFLAENAAFARGCEEAGIVWIGPPPEAIELMGSKVASRERMQAAGVPIIPGTTEPVETPKEAAALGDEYGWPLAIKAAAGGGGKGLKVARSPDEVERA